MMILMRKACCQNSNTDGCGQGVIFGVLRKLERDGIELRLLAVCPRHGSFEGVEMGAASWVWGIRCDGQEGSGGGGRRAFVLCPDEGRGWLDGRDLIIDWLTVVGVGPN